LQIPFTSSPRETIERNTPINAKQRIKVITIFLKNSLAPSSALKLIWLELESGKNTSLILRQKSIKDVFFLWRVE